MTVSKPPKHILGWFWETAEGKWFENQAQDVGNKFLERERKDKNLPGVLIALRLWHTALKPVLGSRFTATHKPTTVWCNPQSVHPKQHGRKNTKNWSDSRTVRNGRWQTGSWEPHTRSRVQIKFSSQRTNCQRQAFSGQQQQFLAWIRPDNIPLACAYCPSIFPYMRHSAYSSYAFRTSYIGMA
jgi:hypothetical protein